MSVALAVGDPVILLSTGSKQTVTVVSGSNITVVNGSGTSNTYNQSLLGYLGATSQITAPRVDNSAVVNPIMQGNDYFIEYTNATTTGFLLRTNGIPSGRHLYVKNSTGTTFNTGDFNVVNGHVWHFIYDGTTWYQIVVA